MPVSLYQALIPTFTQITRAVGGLVDKAEAHCAENGLDPATLIEARIIDDMWPLHYQIQSLRMHSLYAIDSVRGGLFTPHYDSEAPDFAGLRAIIETTLAGLGEVQEEELESFIGKPMRFEAGPYKLDFLAEEFLLSFSQPNFHFHATTAYDILRGKGLPIGKLDYLGAIRKLP